MDRLPSARFWELASADLTLLQELEVPVVTVAPWSLHYDSDQRLKERFDRVHVLRAENYDRLDTLRSKLRRILINRDVVHLLHPDSMNKICDASGGVIRDLIALARDAAEAAYVTEVETVGEAEIAVAIENLGQSYLLGLSPSQIATLRDWNEYASFDPRRPEILELLMTRRVLERSTARYKIHPALASVLLN